MVLVMVMVCVQETMHGSVGLHSALAIKRQRRAREEKRRALERERRMSSPTTSQSSLERVRHAGARRRSTGRPLAPPDHRLATSIGMLHLGVVFLVLGLFLLASGLLPDDLVSWVNGGWWNELVATGLFACALGIFLIVLNRVVSKKEEDDLNEYVSNQLTRSRSGHRLERDHETGCLATKQHRRLMQKKREDAERGLDDLPPVHSPCLKTPMPTPTPPPPNSPPITSSINGDAPYLEKILEEPPETDNRRIEFEMFNKETVSTTTTASLSPGTPSETKELLTNGRYLPMSRM